MKPISLRTVALAAPLLTLGVTYGCAPDEPTPPVTGDAGSSGASASGASNAGTPSTGGSGAGTPSTGGTGAGTPSTGGSGGAPGGSGGSGGAPGGTGGTGGTPGGACTPETCLNDPSSFGNPGWRDSWWVTGCAQKNNHDCITHSACPGGDGEMRGARTVEEFPIGGMAGQLYKVTFRYSAVNEGKVYNNGKKDVPTPNDFSTRQNNDSFYRDGEPVFPSNYNVVKMTVYNDMDQPVRHFYMNAFDSGRDAENHWNFRSEYTKSIVIVGGGKIEHMVQDGNCHAIDNCNDGMVSGNNCSASRNLPGPDGQLMLPAKYMDPQDNMIKNTELLVQAGLGNGRSQPWHAQASHLTVTAMEPTTDPIDHNYP
jgi:hypothetical protein